MRHTLLIVAVGILLGAALTPVMAEEPAPGVPAPDVVKGKAKAMMEKGIEWLLLQQKEDGSFAENKQMEPAVTALAIRAMAVSPMREELMKTDQFKRGVAFVLSCVQEDGGIYIDDWAANYHTSVALSALAALEDPELQDTIKKTQGYVKGVQADEGDGLAKDDPNYGSFGYRKDQRAGDMSNLQFSLSALRDSGLTADDAAWGKALEFVQRCQNVETDGGFIYRPQESKAGVDPEAPDGETAYRSYSSMTYVGLLSMIYCSVDKNDERVQKAVAWLAKHWGFDENYPIELQGLYYNYHTLSRALAAYGEKLITDDQGVQHDWYAELVDALAERQSGDGYWVNTNNRWFETDKTLVTTYCLLALAQPYDLYE
ncbi:MAG: terpene cyclase/mutase family protein [Verrucomicrobia bacterium]|nr:terpene cyclase/mutase family protein [Verrucomicrobiota bacterium]